MNCVVLDATWIGSSAKLTGVVLGKACRILEKAVLGEGTVLGDFSVCA